MRGSRLIWAVAILAGLVLTGPAYAANWTELGSTDDKWDTLANWGGSAVIPGIDADTGANFDNPGNGGLVDINGRTINMPNSTVLIKNKAYTFDDLVGGGSINCDVFRNNNNGGVTVNIPINADNYIKFDRGTWTLQAGAALTTPQLWVVQTNTVTAGSIDANWILNEGAHSLNMGLDLIDTDLIDIKTGFTYNADVDGAIGDGNSIVNIGAASTLNINAPQTTDFPGKINVAAGGVLAGDLTGANYDTTNGNVAFETNAVFAPDANSPVPTVAQIGTILYQAVDDASTGGSFTVGDPATVYKGAAFGPWTGSNTTEIKSVITASAGDLELMAVAQRAEIHPDATLSAPSGTANLYVPGGGAQFQITAGAINGNSAGTAITFNVFSDVGNENQTVLTSDGGVIASGQTFNISKGEFDLAAGATNADVLQGTLNIVGIAALDLTGGTTPLVSHAGGSINLQDNAMLRVNQDADEALSLLTPAQITTAGDTIVFLDSPQTYDITAGSAFEKVLSESNVWTVGNDAPTTFGTDGLLIGDGKFIVTHVYAGGNRREYLQGTIRGESGTTIGFASNNTAMNIQAVVDAPGATLQLNSTDPVTASGTTGNTPTNSRQALVPNDGFRFYEDAYGESRVSVQKIVLKNGFIEVKDNALNTADIVEGIFVENGSVGVSESGSLQLTTVTTSGTGKVSGSGAGGELAIGTLVINNTNGLQSSASIYNRLSGTGSWTGGNGVIIKTGATVAPGASVGTLNDGGGDLTMESGAIYEWEIAGATGTPGIDWDLLKAANITFLGDLTFKVLDAGLAGHLDGSQEFIVADVTGTIDDANMGAVTFDLPGWTGGSLAVVEDSIDGGYDLVLTGLVTSVPGDADDNGVVNAADYIILKTNMGMGTGATTADGDFNGDGKVDWTDLQLLQDNYGEGSGASGSIPEPATLGLLAFGAMAVIRRRQGFGGQVRRGRRS